MFNRNEWIQWAKSQQENNAEMQDFRHEHWRKNDATRNYLNNTNQTSNNDNSDSEYEYVDEGIQDVLKSAKKEVKKGAKWLAGTDKPIKHAYDKEGNLVPVKHTHYPTDPKHKHYEKDKVGKELPPTHELKKEFQTMTPKEVAAGRARRYGGFAANLIGQRIAFSPGRKEREERQRTSATRIDTSRMEIPESSSELDEKVIQYFTNYFGNQLNEDITDGQIEQAALYLVELTESVVEFYESVYKKAAKMQALKTATKNLKKPPLNIAFTSQQKQRKANRRIMAQTDKGQNVLKRVDSGELKTAEKELNKEISKNPKDAMRKVKDGVAEPASELKKGLFHGKSLAKQRLKRDAKRGRSALASRSEVGLKEPSTKVSKEPKKKMNPVLKGTLIGGALGGVPGAAIGAGIGYATKKESVNEAMKPATKASMMKGVATAAKGADILSDILTVGGIIAAPFTGGLSLAGTAAGLAGKAAIKGGTKAITKSATKAATKASAEASKQAAKKTMGQKALGGAKQVGTDMATYTAMDKAMSGGGPKTNTTVSPTAPQDQAPPQPKQVQKTIPPTPPPSRQPKRVLRPAPPTSRQKTIPPTPRRIAASYDAKHNGIDLNEVLGKMRKVKKSLPKKSTIPANKQLALRPKPTATPVGGARPTVPTTTPKPTVTSGGIPLSRPSGARPTGPTTTPKPTTSGDIPLSKPSGARISTAPPTKATQSRMNKVKAGLKASGTYVGKSSAQMAPWVALSAVPPREKKDTTAVIDQQTS